MSLDERGDVYVGEKCHVDEAVYVDDGLVPRMSPFYCPDRISPANEFDVRKGQDVLARETKNDQRCEQDVKTTADHRDAMNDCGSFGSSVSSFLGLLDCHCLTLSERDASNVFHSVSVRRGKFSSGFFVVL